MGSGNEWDASTSNISDDEFIKDLPADHRERIKASLDIWIRTHKTPGTGDYQANTNRGDHKLGTAVAFYADYSGDPDTNLVNRPSGVALDGDDVGRICYDTNDDLIYFWNGTNWISIGIALSAAFILVAHTWAEVQTFSKQSVHTLGLLANGDITLATTKNLVGGADSDILMNTDKFTVTGATGNVVSAGTHDVAGLSTLQSLKLATGATPTEFSTDGTLAGDSDTAVPTEKAVKTYVDDIGTGSAPTNKDSENNAMVKAHAYLSQASGYITAFVSIGSGSILNGYIGETTDPAGAGTLVNSSNAANGQGTNLMMFVPKATYFEITVADTPTIIWTPIIAGVGNPIDQD